MTRENMDKFDWVTARSSCSSVKVFETLKLQVREDIEIRKKLRPPEAHYNFTIVANSESFAVVIEGRGIHDTVLFQLNEKSISVLNQQDKLVFEATLTLNDEGECRVKINGRELELWQMRKMALEHLFFGIV